MVLSPLGLLGKLGTLDQFILLSHVCGKCGKVFCKKIERLIH